MEFVIGNGYEFEEKDVLLAIQTMDPPSQVELAVHVVKCLKADINAGKSELAEKKDKEKGLEAEEAWAFLKSYVEKS